MKTRLLTIMLLSCLFASCSHAKKRKAGSNTKPPTSAKLIQFNLKALGPLCVGDPINKGDFNIKTLPSNQVNNVTLHIFNSEGVDVGLSTSSPGWRYVTAVLGSSRRTARFYVLESDEEYTETPKPDRRGPQPFSGVVVQIITSTGDGVVGYNNEKRNGSASVVGSFPDAPHIVGWSGCGQELRLSQSYSVKVGGKLGVTAKGTGIADGLVFAGEFNMDYTEATTNFDTLPASPKKDKQVRIYNQLMTVTTTGVTVATQSSATYLLGTIEGEWRPTNVPFSEVSQKYGPTKQVKTIMCCGGG